MEVVRGPEEDGNERCHAPNAWRKVRRPFNKSQNMEKKVVGSDSDLAKCCTVN